MLAFFFAEWLLLCRWSTDLLVNRFCISKYYSQEYGRLFSNSQDNKPFPIPPAAPYCGHRIAVPNPQGDGKNKLK